MMLLCQNAGCGEVFTEAQPRNKCPKCGWGLKDISSPPTEPAPPPSAASKIAPVCAHEWLPETQYRLRRCKLCGAHPFEDALSRLRYRAHVHVGDSSGEVPRVLGGCYGEYEPCGEHHAHDGRCGSRRLVCGRREDHDAVALLE